MPIDHETAAGHRGPAGVGSAANDSSPPAITTVNADNIEAAIAVLARAFAADPIARWVWPDDDIYDKAFPPFTRAFGGGAFALGSADLIGHGAGAALWLPPDVHLDDEALGAVMQASVAPNLIEAASDLMEQMASYHPHGPHWYLPLIGVDPAHQNKGYGSLMLRHALLRCDRDHVPAYLESTNPLNVSLYQRHGFEVLSTIRVGSSPPVMPMLRAAR